MPVALAHVPAVANKETQAAGGEPVGWCAVAPRPAFERLRHTKGTAHACGHGASALDGYPVAEPFGGAAKLSSGTVGMFAGRAL